MVGETEREKYTKNIYHLICSSVILFLHVSNFLNFLIRIFITFIIKKIHIILKA